MFVNFHFFFKGNGVMENEMFTITLRSQLKVHTRKKTGEKREEKEQQNVEVSLNVLSR